MVDDIIFIIERSNWEYNRYIPILELIANTAWKNTEQEVFGIEEV